MDLNFLLVLLIIFTIVIWIYVFKNIRDNKKFGKIVGEILFTVGIAILVGTIFKYDVFYDTLVFTIYSLVGMLSLFLGAVLKMILEN